MRWTLTLAFVAVALGCTAKQPESAETVAAFEVPLPTENDRNEFLTVLQSAAKTEGMHVDAREQERTGGPQEGYSLGANDAERRSVAWYQ